jgi:hypothetical protein
LTYIKYLLDLNGLKSLPALALKGITVIKDRNILASESKEFFPEKNWDRTWPKKPLRMQ